MGSGAQRPELTTCSFTSQRGTWELATAPQLWKRPVTPPSQLGVLQELDVMIQVEILAWSLAQGLAVLPSCLHLPTRQQKPSSTRLCVHPFLTSIPLLRPRVGAPGMRERALLSSPGSQLPAPWVTLSQRHQACSTHPEPLGSSSESWEFGFFQGRLCDYTKNLCFRIQSLLGLLAKIKCRIDYLLLYFTSCLIQKLFSGFQVFFAPSKLTS